MGPNSRRNAAEANEWSSRGHALQPRRMEAGSTPAEMPARMRAPEDRDRMAEQIDVLADRLQRLKTSTAVRPGSAEPATRPARAYPRPSDASRHGNPAEDGRQVRLQRIEARLADLARRLDAPHADEHPNRHHPLPVEQDLQQAIREIASRQRALEDEDPASAPMSGSETVIDGEPGADRVRRGRGAGCAARDLEGRVGQLADMIRGLREESAKAQHIDTLLARVGRIEKAVTAPPPGMEALESRLRDLVERIDSLARPEAQPAIAAMKHDVAALRERSLSLASEQSVNALRDDVARLTQELQAGKAFDPRRLDQRIERLEGRVEQVSSQPEIQALEAGIRALHAKLDTLGATVAEPCHVETAVGRIAHLAGVIESERQRLPDEALARLEAQIESLQNRLERRPEQGSLHDIETRLAEIAREIEGPRRPESAVDVSALEAQIADLARKIDAAQRPDAGDRAYAQLEEQIRQLTAQLETAEPHFDAMGSLERSLADIQAAIETNRWSAIEAAEAAARKAAEAAAQEVLAGRSDGQDSEAVISALHDSLLELRQSSRDTDRRTHETLEAVQGLLKSIVERLAELEHGAVAAPESVEPRRERAAAPAERPVSFDETFAALVDLRNLSGPERDRPIEPGSGAPRIAGFAETSPASEPQGDAPSKADFIAAARRAAQQAAMEALAEPAAADDAQAPAGLTGRISALLRERKKPLILAAAAALLVIGSLKLYGLLGQRSAPEVGVAPTAPVAAPAAAAQKPAAQKPETKPETQSRAAPDEGTPRAARALAFENDAAASAESATPLIVSTKPVRAGEAPSREASRGSEAAPARAPMPPEAIGPMKLRQAAAAGDAKAQYEVGIRYTEGSGVARDLAEAARWYGRAAEQGLAPAQYRLGNLYEKGLGIAKDIQSAKLWYELAANAGNRMAMHNLGVLHAEGSIAGKPDYAQALALFRRAAAAGLRDSQFNLGIIYGRGLGAAQDLPESYKWFAIAAKSGDKEAAKRRDEVAEKLDPQRLAAAKDVVEAFTPSQYAAEANEVVPPPGGWGEPAARTASTPTKTEAASAASAVATTSAAAATPASATPASTGQKPTSQKLVVQQVQALLTAQGYDPGPADGTIRRKTQDAVKAFQRKEGLPVTGEITPNLVYRLSGRSI